MLSTKGAYQSTNLVKFHLSSRKSEILHFGVLSWKSTEDLKSDAKFKEKLTCGFKYDMRKLLNFHPTTQKSKNFTLIGYFCRKYITFELKNTAELPFMTQNSDAKLEKYLDLVVSKITWGIGWTFIRAPKSLKNCALLGSFCRKHIYIMFQSENFRVIMCHVRCCKI